MTMAPEAPPVAYELAELGVDHARTLRGFRGCAVLLEEASGVRLRWAANTLVGTAAEVSRSATAVLLADQPGGVALGVISRRVDDARDVVRLVEDAALAAAAAGPTSDVTEFVGGPWSEDWEAPGVRTTPATLAGPAQVLGEVLRRSAGEGREAFGQAQQNVVTTWLATSAGLRLRHEQPAATVQLSGLSHARTRSTWVGRAGDTLAGTDFWALDEQVVRRLGRQERRLRLDPGRYPMVLPPSCVSDLMICLYLAADAGRAYAGRGPFARPEVGHRLGERLSELPLTLRSDPHEPGLACAGHVLAGEASVMSSVMDNGLPLEPHAWISEGVLRALHTTRASARDTGAPPAAPPGNLVLERGSDTGGRGTGGRVAGAEELARGLDRGLLATSLWFLQETDREHLTLTGVLRDGVYVVEQGEIVGVLGDCRFVESPVALLDRVIDVSLPARALGRDWGPLFTRTRMPALLVDGVGVQQLEG